MPYAAITGGRLYYEQHGAGADLVFLYGAGGNHLSWWQQVPVFAARFRCTTFDARAWGRSTSDEPPARGSAGADLLALLDHLGIGSAHLVAQSMGGRAVAGLARLSPGRIRSILLCGTTGGATNDRVRALQQALRAERGDASLREYSLWPGFEAAHPELAFLYRQINALNPPRPRGLLGPPPAGYRGSTHELLAELGAPIRFLVGEHDSITPPEMVREAQGLVGGSLYEQLEGAGHSAYFERPGAWNEAVSRALG